MSTHLKTGEMNKILKKFIAIDSKLVRNKNQNGYQ